MDSLIENPQAILIFIVMIVGAVRALIEKKQAKNLPPPEVDFEDQDLEAIFRQQREKILRRQQVDVDEPNGWEETPATLPPPIPSVKHIPSAVNVREERSFVPMSQVEVYEPPKVKKPVLTSEEQAALERASQNLMRPVKRKSFSRGKVLAMLQDPNAARDAVLLTEILGKPKAL